MPREVGWAGVRGCCWQERARKSRHISNYLCIHSASSVYWNQFFVGTANYNEFDTAIMRRTKAYGMFTVTHSQSRWVSLGCDAMRESDQMCLLCQMPKPKTEPAKTRRALRNACFHFLCVPHNMANVCWLCVWRAHTTQSTVYTVHSAVHSVWNPLWILFTNCRQLIFGGKRASYLVLLM